MLIYFIFIKQKTESIKKHSIKKVKLSSMNENEENDDEEEIRGCVNEEVTIFSDTEEFIDFVFKNEQQKKMLIKEIKDIIHCMKEIL